jgi:hypothetical protein
MSLSNHPIFSQILFDREKHTYTFNGQPLKSVTKVVSELVKPFDSDYWSKRKADERGVSPQTILDEWERKRQASVSVGNRVHAYIEKILKGEQQPAPILSLNQRLPEMDAFDYFWDGDLKSKVSVEAIECVIGDPELGIAGTFDTLICWSSLYFNILDWKTGKFDTDNRFQSLLPPFDDLEDCKLSVSSLQQSLYKLILRRKGDLSLPVGNSYLIHLSSTGLPHIHEAIDLTDRLEDWLLGEK